MPRFVWITPLALLLVFAPTLWARAAPPRFAAQLASGERLQGDQFHNWHDNNHQPKLEGRDLLAADNRMRWLRDRTLNPPAPLTAFVELVNGDCLPGRVIGFEPARYNTHDAAPAAYVVVPVGLAEEVTQTPPPRRASEQVAELSGIRVYEKGVRRLVWQARSSQQYEPGTLFTRDGRTLPFRALRLSSDEVNLLLEKGQQRVPLAEVAEIHLPEGDAWAAYYDELATLSPDLKSPLITVETTAGLAVTASLARLYCRPAGNDKEFDKWIHGLQPWWSPDLLWIRNSEISCRRVFAAHEPPLARFWPAAAVATSPLAGTGRAALRNRNVEGGSLRGFDFEAGGGFGVHAYSELRFHLSPLATGFRTSLALDRLAGNGGCVRGRIFQDSAAAAPLWESGFVQGRQPPVDTGPLALRPAMGNQKRTLLLVVDPAHANRPPEADPFDIRDSADWLDPVLTLDAAQLAAEVASRMGSQLAAWQGWQIESSKPADALWQNVWDDVRYEPDRFATAVAASNEPLRLSRTFKPDGHEHYLVVSATRLKGSEAGPRVEVRVEGELVAQKGIHQRSQGLRDVRPLVFSLDFPAAPANDEGLRIEVSQIADADRTPVIWHGLAIQRQPPQRFQLFDDEGEFTPTAGASPARPHSADRYSQRTAMLLPAGGVYRLNLASSVRIENRPAWGDFQFVQFAVRKKGEGRIGIEFVHSESRTRPARYSLGAGNPVAPGDKKIFEVKLADEWLLTTRDLFADFGPLEIEALEITVPDGQFALLDRVYLGRGPTDFDDLPKPVLATPDPNTKAFEETMRAAVARGQEAFALLDFGGRTAGGAIIDKQGLVLTCGHAAAPPGSKSVVRTPDGREYSGQTLGISRQHNLALVKLNNEQPLPEMGVAAGDLTESDVYALLVPGDGFPREPPAPRYGVLRKNLIEAALVDVKLDAYPSGAPLISREGQVAGILRETSPALGGAMFAKTLGWNELRPRLEKGEVVGHWPRGNEPRLGIYLWYERPAPRVAKVTPNSPAEKAGVKVRDVLAELDSQFMRDNENVVRHLATKMPGDEVSLTLQRGAERITLKATLQPREP